MKYLKMYRNPALAKKLLEEIYDKSETNITVMEVCGTHTMTIFKNGIRNLLPNNINLISGPGCPICVTPQGYIDAAIELCKIDEVILTTFGDMIRVPGTYSSLSIQKALGKDVRIVSSPLQALDIAKQNPKKEVVFLAIGFETTAPIIALSIYMARNDNVHNFSILQSIKTMPNALKKIVLDKQVKIDGFLCPGHVSSIIGVRPFEFLSREFNIPAVIAGFEYCDIIAAINYLVKMIREKDHKIINTYSRVVKYDGNKRAISIIDEVFILSYSMWRGLGNIENTGLILKEKYDDYDAEKKFRIRIIQSNIDKDCICGEILKGLKKPIHCKLFSDICNPANPIGPCMITQEGMCGVYFKYGGK